ncbi:hypothetical protein GQ457_02G042620 [Hibiscus cannabinus]
MLKEFWFTFRYLVYVFFFRWLLSLDLKFDHDACRKALAKMVIVDELAFKFVEREGFLEFCQVMQPKFVVPSRWTITRDCFGIYGEEKNKLKHFFKHTKPRVCLTTDTWTSCQNLSYMCLIAHFIDESWNLHNFFLNFYPISSHSGEAIGKAVEGCLLDWGIENVFTVTVDNASSNDVGIAHLRERLNSWDGCVLNGDFLHMRCASHILNLIVKYGLKECDRSVLKMRAAARYVRSSPARLQRFKACVQQEKIDSKSLVCLDVETRWNSTFLMLESVLKFQKAFSLLSKNDGRYRAELAKYDGVPTDDDWDCIRNLIFFFLKIFHEATVRLSGSLYVTGNMYLQEIFGIGIMISMKCDSASDPKLRKMALSMKKKQKKYWGNINNINLMLFIVVLLDPRRKWKYVNWVIEKSFDEDIALELRDRISHALSSMFASYVVVFDANDKGLDSSVTPMNLEVNATVINDMDDVQTMLEHQFEREIGYGGLEKKTELDKYLAEDCEKVSGKTFDILDWWRKHAARLPIVSRMAKDVLAMPISIVASESAFSTGGRVLDSFMSSLSPRTIEALICAQDWLRTSHSPLFVEETLEDLEKLESDLVDVAVIKDIEIVNMYDD